MSCTLEVRAMDASPRPGDEFRLIAIQGMGAKHEEESATTRKVVKSEDCPGRPDAQPHGSFAATAGRNVNCGRWEGSYRLVRKKGFSGVLRVPSLPFEQLPDSEGSAPWLATATDEASMPLPRMKQQKCVSHRPTPMLLLVPHSAGTDGGGDVAKYDAYWRERISEERLLQSHRSPGVLILFQSYYHGISLTSLDRAQPSTLIRNGLNPEKISALRAIERSTTIASRQERFDAYLRAAREIDAHAFASRDALPGPPGAQAPTMMKWSRPSTQQRRLRFLGVRIVRVAMQDPTIRASQVGIAGLDSWLARGSHNFKLDQAAMHQRVARMNPYVHPVPSNSSLLNILGVSDLGVTRQWGALLRTVGFKGVQQRDWNRLTAHVKNHVLIVRDDPERAFFVAIAEGVTQVHIPRMALQLAAQPSPNSGFDALCFEPPEGLSIPYRAEYFGRTSRELGENIPVVVDGVASRADRVTPYRVQKRNAVYDSDDDQLSVPAR